MKILSVSDVITNSSSEVFIMDREDADYYSNLSDYDYPGIEDCITTYLIDWDFVLHEDEIDAVLYLSGLDRTEVMNFVENPTSYDRYKGKLGYWTYPSQIEWDMFCSKHEKEIQENIIDRELYFVDIEDHFADCRDVLENAHDDCIWSDSRH